MAREKITDDQIQRRLGELTLEEGAALFWRCQGKTVGEIKVAMGVEEETVTLHLARVYLKLGLGSLTDFQRGLVLGSDLGSMLSRQHSYAESDGRDTQTAGPESDESGTLPDSRILTLVKADDLSLSTLPELARALQRPAPPRTGSTDESPGLRALFVLVRDFRIVATLLILFTIILVGVLFVFPSLPGRISRNVNRVGALLGGQMVPLTATSDPGQTGTSSGQNLPTAPQTYTGRHSLLLNSDVTLELSPTGSKVVKISVSRLDCNIEPGGNQHTFSIDLTPGIPINGGRFAARALPVPVLLWAGHSHSLDIDGVFFNADGFGGREQALGGISFVSGDNRCNVQWWATAGPDSDGDGWSDAAERRLGSNPNDPASTPEHREVPTTDLFGPDVCHDFKDNNGNGLIDQADPSCANGP